MNRFYNLKEQKFSLIIKLLHVFTFILTKFFPKLSFTLCLKLLCSPKSRRDYEFRTDVKPQEFDVQTKIGKVKLFKFGDGNNHILCIHGWADSSRRFTHLINFLLKKDSSYTVWAFDHIGHGKSAGNIAHLPGFIDGVNNCIKHISSKGFQIKSYIAHSMGGLALLNQDSSDLVNTKKIIISSPSKFFEFMFLRILKLGFSQTTVEHFLNKLTLPYNKKWDNLAPDIQMEKVDNSYFYVHDKNDDVCSYDNLLALIETKPKQKPLFLTTENLGHLKILKDSKVFNEINEFI